MTRLHDAFERLIASHPEGDPDEVLAAARRRSAAPPRRVAIGIGAAAAAAIVVVATIALIARDDGTDKVRTGPADTTTSTEETTASRTVAVYFSPPDDPTCAATTEVRVQAGDEAPAAAMEALLRGPSGASGQLASWFSTDTAGMLHGMEVVDGTAYVDFENFASVIPNASTSCGSTNLLAQLDATVTQFDDIDRGVYSFDGDVEAFYGWLQMDVPDDSSPKRERTAPPDGYVVAGPDGVSLVAPDGTRTVISPDGSPTAYAIGTELVVLEDSVSAVAVWADGELEALDTPTDAREVSLLDAAPVHGHATALLAERSGTTGGDGVETLVQVDLTTQQRTVVATRPDPRSVYRAARLLSDGDVVALIETQGDSILGRWTPGDDQPSWTNVVDRDLVGGLASGGGRISIVERPIWQEAGTAMGVSDLDVRSGTLGSPVQFHLAPTETPTGLVPVCSDWWSGDVLICSMGVGPPVTVGLDGTVRTLDADPGAVASPSR